MYNVEDKQLFQKGPNFFYKKPILSVRFWHRMAGSCTIFGLNSQGNTTGAVLILIFFFNFKLFLVTFFMYEHSWLGFNPHFAHFGHVFEPKKVRNYPNKHSQDNYMVRTCIMVFNFSPHSVRQKLQLTLFSLVYQLCW